MKILVARILGRDLEPRHARGAQQQALEYILNHERPPSRVDRLFVLNRIGDPYALDAMRTILEDRGENFVTASATDTKVNDGVEINRVRNTVLEYGFGKHYHWVFPLDGRCYIPEKAYSDMKNQCAAFSERHYAFMPQHRVTDYQDVDNDLRQNIYAFAEKRPNGGAIRNEYALGVSINAKDRFNEHLPYGKCPKAEMLQVAGIPGPWINWCDAAEAEGYPIRGVGDDEFASTHPPQYSGWCLVLPSGVPDADLNYEMRERLRGDGLKNIQ